MLTADLKNELAKALATSALGYANMSKNDPSLSINLNLLNSGNRRPSNAPREASGPLRKRKLVAISGDDKITSNLNIPSKNTTTDTLQNMVSLSDQSSYNVHYEENNDVKRVIAKNFYTTNTTTRGLTTVNKTIVPSVSPSHISFECTGTLKNKKNSMIIDTGKLDNESVIRKARETRLEQNRIAARKSRMRKKTMIHNFHNSIMYYTHANAALKQENESLESMLKAAKEFIKERKSNETESRCEPNTIEADFNRVESSDVPSGVSLVSLLDKSSSKDYEPCRTHNVMNLNDKASVQAQSLCGQKLNEVKLKNEVENSREDNTNETTFMYKKVPQINLSSKPSNNSFVQQDIKLINPNIIPSINSTVKANINEGDMSHDDGKMENIKRPILLSPIVTQSQNHQIAAAAACAANLQIAAANFQAALVASMGNPILSQLDPSLIQGANIAPPAPLSQSTVNPYQNLSVFLPLLSGSNLNASNGGAAGLSSNLSALTNMTYNQQNLIQQLQQNHSQSHVQPQISTSLTNNESAGVTTRATNFGGSETTIKKHIVETSPAPPAIVVTSDQDDNLVS